MAENIHAKAVAQRGLLQKIGNFIPGFRGYQKSGEWRNVDQVQRDWCATKLSECKSVVKNALDDVLMTGNLDGLMFYEKLLNRLDAVASMIKNADRGWSGMFDTIKVGDEQLEKVYEFDLSLAEGVAEVRNKVGQLPALASEPPRALGLVKESTDLVNKVQEYFGRREDILRKG